MKEEKIELGDKVKHIYTEVKGVAVSRTTYLSGCNRITIQQKVDKDGKLPDGLQFDEPEIIVVKKRKLPKEVKKEKSGGWKPTARHYLKG
jgi:hypothetical protein